MPRKAARMRISVRATAFWGLVLGYATTVHACGYHIPDSVSTFPGMGFYRPDLLFLFPILSGTLERPIYSLAGYRTSTLGFSIQANFLASMLIGVVGFFAYGALWRSELFLAVLIGAPFIAMAVKLWWFARVPREDHSRGRVGWFFLATLLSTLTIALIPLWMHLLGTDRYSYAEKVQALKVIASVLVLFAAIGTHCMIFSRFRRDSVVRSRRGFEVLPATRGSEIPFVVPAATE